MSVCEKREDFSFIKRPYSGKEIAEHLGTSRQLVSNVLKKAMEKVYRIFTEEQNLSPYEAAITMMYGFNLAYDDESEIKKFFKAFPPNVKKEIEKDASMH